jgi:hypothetical protein
VSRKDQMNKKKLSPLTNHKNTKKGTVTGGFDRVNLFQQVEQGFDRLFGYNRKQLESFDYRNTMKNGSISEQLELQNQDFTSEKKKETFQSREKENMISCILDSKQENKYSNNQQNNSSGNSLRSIFSLGDSNSAALTEESQAQKCKKKKELDNNRMLKAKR